MTIYDRDGQITIEVKGETIEVTFEEWISLAFPWLAPHSRDYRNLRHAWEAGYAAAKAGKEAK